MFTRLATKVAAASAAAPVSASTVTESAIPSEKLRPRQPEVAIPRIGEEAPMPKRPSIPGSARLVTTPTR